MRHALLALSLLCTSACTPTPAPTGAEPPAQVLASYEVPAAHRDAVRSALQRVMRGDDGAGRVVDGPAGTLVVHAPDAIQSGVRALLEGLPATANTPVAANVTITYWLVQGSPAAQAPALGPELAPLTDVLGRVASTDGPQAFQLVGRTALTAADGGDARGELFGASVHQVVTVGPDGSVVADLEVQATRGTATAARVRLQPDQTLVLAALGDADPDTPAIESLYIAVRAHISQ